MHHDWIFDVLTDLRSYALRNGLMALAGQAEQALQVAMVEIGTPPALTIQPGEGDDGNAPPPRAN